MKIGIIGTGKISKIIASQFVCFDDVELYALCSIDLKSEIAKEMINQYGIKKVYTDVREMVSDENVDLVYIASPNSLHYEHAIISLRGGKDVVVEKPFCSNLDECKKLFEESRKYGKYIFEAITTIHNPNFQEIKKHLNEISPIKMVQCNMINYSKKYDSYKQGKHENVFSLDYSGGALMDYNIYNVHFAIGLFGCPKKVEYICNKGYNGIDTSGVIVLTYDGFICNLTACKDSMGESGFSIYGEHGVIVSRNPISSTSSFTIQQHDSSYKEINVQNKEIFHYYWIENVIKIINSRDDLSYLRLCEHTKSVMEIVDDAKNNANIVFLSDNKQINC